MTPTSDRPATADARSSSRALVRRFVPIVVIIAALAAAAHFVPLRAWLTALEGYVRQAGVWGPVLYAAVYALCCVLFIPASLLTLAAGAIFGLARGSLVVLAGANAGAIASFLLARGALRRRIEAMVAGNERFRALDRAIAQEGAKIVFLTRLSPVFPFTYINYAFGLTGISLLRYAAATFAGIIPGTIAFIYLGSAAAGVATGSGSHVRLTLQIVGALATLAVTLFVARLARNAIRRAGVEDGEPTSPPAS